MQNNTIDLTLIDTSLLISRWANVNSRQALLTRMASRDIKPFKSPPNLKKAYIYQWQLDILDDLDKFLQITKLPMAVYSQQWKDNLTEEELEELKKLEATKKICYPEISKMSETVEIKNPDLGRSGLDTALILAVGEIISRLPKNEDSFLERLQAYATNEWWNTGTFFAQMIGLQRLPKSGFTAYGFKFTKISKKSKWWKINKI